jgi:hypothetical protein
MAARGTLTRARQVARQAGIMLTTANDLQCGGYGFDLGLSDGIGSRGYIVDLVLTFGDER